VSPSPSYHLSSVPSGLAYLARLCKQHKVRDMARVFGALVDTTRKGHTRYSYIYEVLLSQRRMLHVFNQCATSIVCVCSSVHSDYSVSLSAPCESVWSTSSACGHSQLVHHSTVQHHSIHGGAAVYSLISVSYIQRLLPALGA
jgi:hypothetical protein